LQPDVFLRDKDLVKAKVGIPHPTERGEGPPDLPAAAPSPGEPWSIEKQSSVLIVEDDFLIAMQMEAALSDAGVVLAGVARSAKEALDLADSQRPALAIMDIRLAGKRDGVDAALDLFRKHGIRCIFAPAHKDPEVSQRAGPALPLGWLQKPYTMKSLIEAVRKALNELTSEKR
jgi:DNA-binding NarL/FixJ family response regulator